MKTLYKQPLEYSITELPEMLELGIRQNMLTKKYKNLWPNAISQTKDLVMNSNPINNSLYKNMDISKFKNHINKTPTPTTIHGLQANEQEKYYENWHFEDGQMNPPMYYSTTDKTKLLEYANTNTGLKAYEPYMFPTGRLSDIAFLNTTAPIGFRVSPGTTEVFRNVFSEIDFESLDMSCINIIFDIGKDSNVTFEETIVGKTNGCKLIKVTYIVRDNSKLDIIRSLKPKKGCHTIVESKIIQMPFSRCKITSDSIGSNYNQEIFDVDLYRWSNLEIKGRYNLHYGDYSNHVGVFVNHLEKESDSKVDIKSVVDKNSKSSFIGSIFVDKSATDTNASLYNKNLLLSNNATAVSEPQLDINNKNIKCSHGCTVSNIDEEQLYMLTTRGIEDSLARNVLKECFLK